MYKIIGADGKEYGPVDLEQIKRWIQDGRAGANTKIKLAEATEWGKVGDIPELAACLPVAPPTGTSMSPESTLNSTPQTPIPNYLVQAILCTVCCCLPAGIAAIVYAAQVNSKQAAGDYVGAQAASKNAKMWCWISFGVGLPLTIIITVIQFLAAFSEAGNY